MNFTGAAGDSARSSVHGLITYTVMAPVVGALIDVSARAGYRSGHIGAAAGLFSLRRLESLTQFYVFLRVGWPPPA